MPTSPRQTMNVPGYPGDQGLDPAGAVIKELAVQRGKGRRFSSVEPLTSRWHYRGWGQWPRTCVGDHRPRGCPEPACSSFPCTRGMPRRTVLIKLAHISSVQWRSRNLAIGKNHWRRPCRRRRPYTGTMKLGIMPQRSSERFLAEPAFRHESVREMPFPTMTTVCAEQLTDTFERKEGDRQRTNLHPRRIDG